MKPGQLKKQRIEAFEILCYRKMPKISLAHKITNEEVYERAELQREI